MCYGHIQGKDWGTLHQPGPSKKVASHKPTRNRGPPSDKSTALAEELYHFFACFELNEADIKATPPGTVTTSHVLNIKSQDVKHVISTVNAKKAAGSDGSQRGYSETVPTSLSMCLPTYSTCLSPRVLYPPALNQPPSFWCPSRLIESIFVCIIQHYNKSCLKTLSSAYKSNISHLND